MMLLALPDDVFYVIFNYLTLRDLTALKVVNRRLYRMVDKYVRHKLESCWHGITRGRRITAVYLTAALSPNWSFGAPLLDNIIQLGQSNGYDVGEVIHLHDDKYSHLVELQDGDEVLYECGEDECNIIHTYLRTGIYPHAYMYYYYGMCRLFLFPKNCHDRPISIQQLYRETGQFIEGTDVRELESYVKEMDVMKMLRNEILPELNL